LALFAAPILFGLILSGVAIGIPWYIHEKAFSVLRVLGVAVIQDNETHELLAKFPYYTDEQTVRTALPNLFELGMKAIDFSFTKLSTLPALPTSLQTLDLSGTEVKTLPALPTSLQTLKLGYTNVTTLPTLPTTLRTLDLRGTKVPANDPAVELA
jgi:hypothetical protein